jgi:peptidoglycan/LPS O-acetylase OafA/YrhL
MPQSPERYDELDSLRGVAALVVVFYHFSLLRPFHTLPGHLQTLFSLGTHPLLAGHEAVLLFFALSGFVLALPFLKNKQQPYPIFIQRRILRIYGPYLAALLLAVIGCVLFHSEAGQWRGISSTWADPVAFRSVFQHVLFLGDYPSHYNWAFWSLVYEMRISLIFPFLIEVVRRSTAFGVGLLTASCLVIGVTYLPTFEYMAIFILGILLAQYRRNIGYWLTGLSPAKKYAFAAVAFLLYEEGHVCFRSAQGAESRLADIPEALGAAGLILVALYSTRVRRLLLTRVPAIPGQDLLQLVSGPLHRLVQSPRDLRP